MEDVISGQVRARKALIIEYRVGSVEDCFALARAQGELAGLQLILGLPKALMEELVFEIERRENENGQ